MKFHFCPSCLVALSITLTIPAWLQAEKTTRPCSIITIFNINIFIQKKTTVVIIITSLIILYYLSTLFLTITAK